MSSGLHSTTFSSSSSATQILGADGRLHSQEHAAESKSVDGVLEGRSHYRDSLGNERKSESKGVGEAIKETIWDKNASGQTRQTQNLKGIEQGAATGFDNTWNEAAGKVDPGRNLLGRGCRAPQDLDQHPTKQLQ